MLAHPTMPNQTFPSSKWVQLVSGFHEPLEAKMKSLEAKIAEMQVLTGFDLLLAQPVDPSRKCLGFPNATKGFCKLL